MAGLFRSRVDQAELLAAEPGDEPPRRPERVLPEMTTWFHRSAIAMAACGFVAWIVYRRGLDTGSFMPNVITVVGAIAVATLSYYAVYLTFLGIWAVRKVIARSWIDR